MANERARQAIASQKTPFDISPIANYKMVNLLARKPLKWVGWQGKKNGAGDFRFEVARASPPTGRRARFLDRQTAAALWATSSRVRMTS